MLNLFKFNCSYNIIGLCLLIWFCIGCITIPLQNTITLPEKIFGVGTNLLMIGFIIHSILGDPNTDKQFWLVGGIMCLIWYGFYTFVDASGITAHSPLISFFYVIIDILSFLYVGIYLIDNILIPYHYKQYLKNNLLLNIFLNIASFSPLRKWIYG